MDVTPEFLADYGSIGVFLSFMIYQFLQQKAEIKNITQAFFDQTDKIEEKYEHRITDVRNRYDQVIKDYKADLEKAAKDKDIIIHLAWCCFFVSVLCWNRINMDATSI